MMKPVLPCVRAVLFGVLCGVALTASAQWSWLDKDGRKVFSDQPPPLDVMEKNILQRPRAGAPAAPARAAAAAKPSGTDRELAEKIKQADDSEAARKRTEQERVAAVKTDNCNRAQQAKSTYESGVMLTRITPQGVREVLDQTARDSETRRLDTIIASDCR